LYYYTDFLICRDKRAAQALSADFKGYLCHFPLPATGLPSVSVWFSPRFWLKMAAAQASVTRFADARTAAHRCVVRQLFPSSTDPLPPAQSGLKRQPVAHEAAFGTQY
jgi:hypothetical protein